MGLQARPPRRKFLQRLPAPQPQGVSAREPAALTRGAAPSARPRRTRRLLAEVPTGSQVDGGAFHRGSTLLACVGADRAVRVFDVSASPPRRVRVFPKHGDRVTDLTFSADAKWLVTACMDGVVRVWDVPAARLLQSLRLGEPVTSLSLSPGGELLATSHVGQRCAPRARARLCAPDPWRSRLLSANLPLLFSFDCACMPLSVAGAPTRGASRRGIHLWANRLVYSAATEASLAPADGAHFFHPPFPPSVSGNLSLSFSLCDCPRNVRKRDIRPDTRSPQSARRRRAGRLPRPRRRHRRGGLRRRRGARGAGDHGRRRRRRRRIRRRGGGPGAREGWDEAAHA